MRTLTRPLTRLLLTSVVVISAVPIMGSPASAAYDDSFSVSTTDGCGRADFVDYGDGAPGGGYNDDYVVLRDRCGDGHGVKVFVKLTKSTTQGPITFGPASEYNGSGSGTSVIFDPFKVWDPDVNVAAGNTVWMRVCIVDGRDDTTPSRCLEAASVSQDG